MADGMAAVYWDFENIHASVGNARSGPDWYRASRLTSQEALVEIRPIMELVAGYGEVLINRAYNDWQVYGAYRDALLLHAVEPIQIYPKGMAGKNGADIRLALDALEDAHRYPNITHFVIVGGDSDYISLAQKLRQNERNVIGIGAKGTTNKYWPRTCNEFKFYETLVKSPVLLQEPKPIVEAKAAVICEIAAGKKLLVRAVTQLRAQGGEEGGVLKARLLPMMVRLDSAFDPAGYGFRDFDGFLNACGDTVRVTKGKHDSLVSLLDRTGPPTALLGTPIEAVCRRYAIVLLEPARQRRLLALVHSVLAGLKRPAPRKEILAALHGDPKLRADFGEEELPRSRLSQIFQRLFFSRCFTIKDGPQPVRMTLAEETQSFEELRRRHDRAIISVVLRNGIELSATEWTKLLRGDDGGSNEIEGLIEAARGLLQPAA